MKIQIKFLIAILFCSSIEILLPIKSIDVRANEIEEEKKLICGYPRMAELSKKRPGTKLMDVPVPYQPPATETYFWIERDDGWKKRKYLCSYQVSLPMQLMRREIPRLKNLQR